MTEDKLCGDFKKKMLFLDDRTKRIESAMRQYAGKYELTIVTNAKECLRYMCREKFDIISLDHDLNGDDFQDPDDVTSGMEVVRYIEKCGAETVDDTEFWVHSSNLFAANLMITRLTDLGLKAYYHRFQYDEEKESANRPYPKFEDKWVSTQLNANCIACGKLRLLDENGKCRYCYIEEAVSSQNVGIQDYWKMKRENKQCA